MAELLTGNARAAAHVDDCGAVEVLGNRVKELDRDYYERIFVTDPVLAKCGPRPQPTAQETALAPAPPVLVGPRKRPGLGDPGLQGARAEHCRGGPAEAG